MAKQPSLFIISGPGGVGKTTLLKKLFRKKIIRENFIKSISYTTRCKRSGEKSEKDYFFVTKKKFLELRSGKFFLESERVVEDYYGTPRFLLDRAKKQDKGLLLCIDVKGVRYLSCSLKNARIISVFIEASAKELKKRFKKRKEDPTIIKKRLLLAKQEAKYKQYYDYCVVNDEVAKAVDKLKDILLSEKK